MAMRRKQAVTVYDIALQAGVSPATVSRVLRGTSPVAQEKRAAVLAAVEALHYRPNLMARDLASGDSHTVGLVVPDTVSSFWGPLVKGVEAALREQDYHLLIASAEGCEGEQRALDLLLSHQVDGLVIAGGTVSEDDVVAVVGDVPFVAVSRGLPRAEWRITVHNREGARRATEHLIELGHTRIAYIGGPLGFDDASERQQGYVDALAAAGVPFDPSLVVEGDFKLSGGRRAMQVLLTMGREFTAVFCASDQMAMAAMAVLREHGFELPSDVSVVGFDDEAFAAYCCPPLTTMRQPMFEMGQEAVRNILARHRGLRPMLPSFGTALIVRASTAAPADGAPPSKKGRTLPGRFGRTSR
jgi:LacI family transcriptional regulator